MTSLGDIAYCNTLTSNTVEVKGNLDVKGIVSSDLVVLGEVHARQKTLHDGGMHKHVIKQLGSIIYFMFEEYHSINRLGTTAGTKNVVLNATTNVGLVGSGSRVEVLNLSVEDINGIPSSELVGGHVTTGSYPTAFIITSVSDAASSGTVDCSGLIRIRRYKYLDMHGNGVTWEYSSTLPTHAHTNTEVDYA